MTLDTSALTQAFRDFFTGAHPELPPIPATFDAAGARWASLYAAYAAAAQAGPTTPTSATVDTATRALGTALAGAFGSTTSAADLIPRMVTAFSAFWPSLVFAGVNAAGIATSPPPNALSDALTAFITAGDPTSSPPPDPVAQAGRMASLLDEWTRSVAVVNTLGGIAQPPVPLR